MSEPRRSRRRAVTNVIIGLGAVIVLAVAAVAVVVLTDVVVDEERRTPPTLPIAVPTDAPVAQSAEVTVAAVVTGDELVVDDGARRLTIRVAGIDAPDVDTDQCWSAESRSFAERTLTGQRVTTDGAPLADGARVRVRLTDGTDFAMASVEAGMARAIANIDLTTAEQAARAAGAGLWGEYCEGQLFPPVDGPPQPPPSTFTPPTT